MKILNLEIITCKNCPYVDIYYEGLSNSVVKCGHRDSPVLNHAIKFTVDVYNMPIPSEIPKWCPLPDKDN